MTLASGPPRSQSRSRLGLRSFEAYVQFEGLLPRWSVNMAGKLAPAFDGRLRSVSRGFLHTAA